MIADTRTSLGKVKYRFSLYCIGFHCYFPFYKQWIKMIADTGTSLGRAPFPPFAISLKSQTEISVKIAS